MECNKPSIRSHLERDRELDIDLNCVEVETGRQRVGRLEADYEECDGLSYIASGMQTTAEEFVHMDPSSW